jgi:HK97 family phage prohead protease
MKKKKLLQEKKEISKAYSFETKSIDKDNFTIEGIFSTEEVDRHGEIVMQNGWKLEAYRQNPQVLWAHKSDQLPIAKMIDIGINAMNQLEGKMQFAVNEYPFAKTVFDMYAGGFMKAFSAGFMNEIWQINESDDTVILNENELFEVSCVPIPANKLALVKAKGIDTELYEKEMAEAGYVKQVQFEVKEVEKDVDDKGALEIISKSNQETIRSAISTLTGLLKPEAKADNQVGKTKVEHPEQSGGKKTIPVKTLNKAIRDLLGVKRSLNKNN